VGVEGLRGTVVITPDARSYCYPYMRRLDDVRRRRVEVTPSGEFDEDAIRRVRHFDREKSVAVAIDYLREGRTGVLVPG
jgi:hypothetical protein